MYRKRREGVPVECYHFDGKHRPIIFRNPTEIARQERRAQKTALKLSDKYTMVPSSVKISHARDRRVKVTSSGEIRTNRRAVVLDEPQIMPSPTSLQHYPFCKSFLEVHKMAGTIATSTLGNLVRRGALKRDKRGEMPKVALPADDLGRELMVDCGASTHLVSKKYLTPAETETIRQLDKPYVLRTANKYVEAKEECDIYCNALDIWCTAKILPDCPPLLSSGQLGIGYGIRHVIDGPISWLYWKKDPKRTKIFCNVKHHVPFITAAHKVAPKPMPKPKPTPLPPLHNHQVGGASSSSSAWVPPPGGPPPKASGSTGQPGQPKAGSTPKGGQPKAKAKPKPKQSRTEELSGPEPSHEVGELSTPQGEEPDWEFIGATDDDDTDWSVVGGNPNPPKPHKVARPKRAEKLKLCTQEHNLLTHFPKDPRCPICIKCKPTRAYLRTKSHGEPDSLPTPKEFGDAITADRSIINKDDASRTDDRVACVIMD